MKLKKGLLFFLFLPFSLLFSFSAFAVESPHILEIRSSIGGVDSSNEEGATTEELNDISSGHLNYAYHYKIHENFFLGIEKSSGDTDFFIGVSDLFTDSKLDYDVINLVATGRVFVSQRNQLYAKMMSSHYDFEVMDDGEVVGSDDGSDFSYGVGWRYTWDFGLGTSFGFDSMSLGSDIRINSMSLGLHYEF